MYRYIIFLSIFLNGIIDAQQVDLLKEPITFPAGFLKGVAYSTYQNSGHHHWPSLNARPKSNWTHFENNHSQWIRIDRRKGWQKFLQTASPIDYGQKVGLSAHTWVHMFDDIKLMKDLGVNTVRFELPWTDLNPEEGLWNEEAFQLFDRYIDALHDQGIEPMITLYHWVHPQWFANKGGWEKGKNITYFIDYCTEVFKRFGHKVHYWCTINEPTVISGCGYILGSHAPGVMNNYTMAGIVLGHLLKAHVRAYTTLKKMRHGDKAKICLVHQMALFDAVQWTYLKPLEIISKMMVQQFSRIFAHDVVLHFLKTGEFHYDAGGKHIDFIDKRAPKTLDFIGLNFYAPVTFAPWPTCEAGEIMTDMDVWPIRPQSLYKAIKTISVLNVPIIITENGIPDAKDDRRERWIIGYTKALKQAVDDGYDVRGYYYWSLLDNYEWNMGHDKKFGLYAVDTLSADPAAKSRRLREGAKAYRDYFLVGSLPSREQNMVLSP